MLSEIIVEIFPTELIGTYYVPAHDKLVAKGKLYSQYTNYKKKLIKQGLRENNRPAVLSNKRKTDTEGEEAIDFEQNKLNDTDFDKDQLATVQDAIDFIKGNVGPLNITKLKWKETHSLRYNLINLPTFIISEYIQEFSVLLQEIGHEFVSFLLFFKFKILTNSFKYLTVHIGLQFNLSRC